jgi:myo-inositol-hexaphosphate 3-phosphohydrolase
MKQLFASQLQASITSSLIVPSADPSSLTNNLEGATYVLEYAGKAYTILSAKRAHGMNAFRRFQASSR